MPSAVLAVLTVTDQVDSDPLGEKPDPSDCSVGPGVSYLDRGATVAVDDPFVWRGRNLDEYPFITPGEKRLRVRSTPFPENRLEAPRKTLLLVLRIPGPLAHTRRLPPRWPGHPAGTATLFRCSDMSAERAYQDFVEWDGTVRAAGVRAPAGHCRSRATPARHRAFRTLEHPAVPASRTSSGVWLRWAVVRPTTEPVSGWMCSRWQGSGGSGAPGHTGACTHSGRLPARTGSA